MTEKQKRFADEYLIDLNATRAYKVAYPRVKKDDTAAQLGSRMLRNAKVKDYIQQRMKNRQERTEITQDRVVMELAAIAFAKVTDYAEVEDDGVTVKPTGKLTEYQKRAIAGIKQGKFGIEVKLNDKEKALELLGRHLGMFRDKVELSGSLKAEETKLDELIRQMRGGDG